MCAEDQQAWNKQMLDKEAHFFRRPKNVKFFSSLSVNLVGSAEWFAYIDINDMNQAKNVLQNTSLLPIKSMQKRGEWSTDTKFLKVAKFQGKEILSELP